jgi:hypothetical protein
MVGAAAPRVCSTTSPPVGDGSAGRWVVRNSIAAGTQAAQARAKVSTT